MFSIITGDAVHMLMHPHENPFRSHRPTFDDQELDQDGLVTTNHFIYAFRGVT